MPDPRDPQQEQYSESQNKLITLIGSFYTKLSEEKLDFGARGEQKFDDVIQKFSIEELEGFFETRDPRNKLFEAIILKKRYKFKVEGIVIMDERGKDQGDILYEEELENFIRDIGNKSKERIQEDLDTELQLLRIYLKEQTRLKI